MRSCVAFGLSVLGMASAASADSPFNHFGEEGDSVVPITSYPLGQSEVVAHASLLSLRYYWIEKDLCDRYGCLVVRNESKNYKVAEFRIMSHLPDGTKRWSANLLDHPMLQTDTVTRIKTASIDCDRPIRFLLKQRKTKETVVMEGTTNLCSTPHMDNLIRINVKVPEVTVDD